MKGWRMLCCVCMLMPGWASPEQPYGQAEPDTTHADAGLNVRGDILHLANGKFLRGVQVWSETPSAYVIEVQPGDISLRIPRSQVVSVEYDDYDPVSGGRRNTRIDSPETVLLPAEEMSPEFARRLTSVVSEPGLVFENRDFIEIAQALARRAGVPLAVEPGVRALSAEQRAWNYAPPPGITFSRVIYTLAETFPMIRVVVAGDRVVMKTRETPPKQADSGRRDMNAMPPP
jgi:hypothetical protein